MRRKLDRVLNRFLVAFGCGVILMGSVYQYHAVSLGSGGSADVPVTITYDGRDDSNEEQGKDAKDSNDKGQDSSNNDKDRKDIQSGDENMSLSILACCGAASLSSIVCLLAFSKRKAK